MEPIFEQEVAVNSIQELANGKVRLSVRNQLTEQEIEAYKRQGAGATLGNQVFAFEADNDQENPYKPGETLKLAISRGAE